MYLKRIGQSRVNYWKSKNGSCQNLLQKCFSISVMVADNLGKGRVLTGRVLLVWCVTCEWLLLKLIAFLAAVCGFATAQVFLDNISGNNVSIQQITGLKLVFSIPLTRFLSFHKFSSKFHQNNVDTVLSLFTANFFIQLHYYTH